MALARKPIIYDDVSNRLREGIGGAEVIDASFLPLGPGMGVGADGSITMDPSALVSSDTDNQITIGSDKGLFVPPVEIPEVDAAALVSNQAGNDIIIGTDGKLYAHTMDGIDIDANDKVLSKSANGLLATVRLTYVSTTGTIRLTGRDNVLLGSVTLPENQILNAAELVENPDSLAPGTYIKFTFDTTSGPSDMYLDVTKLVDIYTAADTSIVVDDYAVKVNIDANSALTAGSNGVTIKLSKMLSSDPGNRLKIGADNKFFVEPAKAEDVVVDPADNILSVTSNGVSATVELSFDEASQEIRLLGRGGAVLGSVELPDTRILKTAELVTDPSGQPKGTYVKLVFSTSDGGTTGMYINVTQLIDVYTASDASVVVENKSIRANVDPAGALAVNAAGLGVRFGDLVSSDAGNRVVQGTDGKLFSASVAATDISVDPADKFLSTSAAGMLATIGLKYDSVANKIRLTGRGGDVVSSVQLPDVKLLRSAELVTDPPEEAAGTYIKLTFDTSGGGTSTLFLNVTSLVDVYTAADASVVVDGNTIKANLSPDSALGLADSGIIVEASKLVSSDSDNLLTAGSDDKLFVSGAGISRGRDTVTVDNIDAIPSELSEGGTLILITG